MSTKHSWITPFMKQCYVTTGVALNMLSLGLVSGYSGILLPQLRRPDSSIQIDETSESWIVSVYGITLIIGSFINSVIMDSLGRKNANIISVIIIAAGWYMIVWTSSVPFLIVSRAIQGLSLGMSSHLCPVMIGEYTSPRNRGSFLATLTLAISFGVFTTHTLGSFLHWRTTALICGIIMTVDLLIVSLSPETPSGLMNKGKYDECKAVFRWLRGLGEEAELRRMIEVNAIRQSRKKVEYEHLMQRFLNGLEYVKVTLVKKEFYRPCLIVMHLYALAHWGGSSTLSQFTTDIFSNVVGDKVDIALMTVTLAVHRVISGIYLTILMDKFSRRTMLISFGTITVISLLAIAGYSYVRPRNFLPFDHPAIGIVLIHIHMVSISSGCVALGYIIAGELFPLEYKALAGGMSVIFLSGNFFIVAKTGPYFLGVMGIQVCYYIYAGISAYCLVITVIYLPETKNRTLQDIEDEFRKSGELEEAAAEPLNVQ